MTPQTDGPFTDLVRLSVRYSCGCSHGKGEALPMKDANVWPGYVVICDKHDEWAIVTRVSTYLDISPDTLRRIAMRDGGLDEGVAEQIVHLASPS